MKLQEKNSFLVNNGRVECYGCGAEIKIEKAYEWKDRYYCSEECCMDEEFFTRRVKKKMK